MLTIDPAVFRPEAVPPETQALNDQVEAYFKTVPSIMEVGAAKTREARAKGEGPIGLQPPHPIARWETAQALGLDVPVRVFRPSGVLKGVYLHIHGGGWSIGSADAQDQTLGHLAESLSIGVVSVEYRLAPEHVWPAQGDDCEAAALWLAEHTRDLFGTDKITIGGESAGAHLSAVTMLRLKARTGFRFLGANLVYGAYDFSETPSARNWGERNLILSTPIVRWFSSNVRPAKLRETYPDKDPDLSPLYADLTGLGPALFSVGTQDLLLDDTLFMAQKWLSSGNAAELVIYPGAMHGFDMFPGVTPTDQHRQRTAQFIADCLA